MKIPVAEAYFKKRTKSLEFLFQKQNRRPGGS